jgi:hypothetical protein
MPSWETIKDTVEWAGKLIENGRPHASLPRQMANGVPDVSDWQDLTDVKGPQTILWAPHYTNGFGLDVVKFKVALNWDFGARYHNGGAFIPNVWVEVQECRVLWGFDLDLEFRAQRPTNANSSGQPPHARITCEIFGTVSNVLNSWEIGYGFTLFGDGHSDSRATN